MKQDYPKISIVTPSFNSARYIEDCIQSVLNQNYPNIEHIIIDGGSTDGTIEILKKYPHLKWISEPDEGQSDALNKGFHLASGDWIIWLNSDDTLQPFVIEKYVEEIMINPDLNVIYGHINFVDEHGKFLKTVYNIPLKLTYLRHFVYMPPTSGVCFKAKFIKENPLNKNYHYIMDAEWYIRNSSRLNTKCINYIVSNFRISEQSKTSNYITKNLINKQHKYEQQMLRILYQKKYGNVFLDLYYFSFKQMFYRILIKLQKMKYIHKYFINKCLKLKRNYNETSN